MFTSVARAQPVHCCGDVWSLFQLYVFGKHGVDEELVRDLGGANNASRTLLLFPSDEARTVEDVAATHQCFSDDADGPPLQIMVVDGSFVGQFMDALTRPSYICQGNAKVPQSLSQQWWRAPVYLLSDIHTYT